MFIILIVLCLAGTIWSIYQGWDFDGVGGAILGGILGLLISLLVFLVGGLICMGIMSCYDEAKCETIYGEKPELVALVDNSMMSGHSYLGSGYFNENLKYVYLYEDPVKGMKAEKIDADYAYIKYISENETPYIQPWCNEPKNGFMNFMFGDFATTYYTIYLPEGSVITNTYNIDLQ